MPRSSRKQEVKGMFHLFVVNTMSHVLSMPQDAAKIKAKLAELTSQLGYEPVDPEMLSTSSNTVTHGVRVQVQR